MLGRTRIVSTLGAALLAAAVAPAWSPSAVAGPSPVVAAWSFDQVRSGGKVIDVSGNGHGLVLAGTWSQVAGKAGTKAVRFAKQSYGSVRLPSPGSEDLAVTLVFRARNRLPLKDSPNLIQAGLFGDAGQVKAQISDRGNGVVQCRFKGTAGAVLLDGPAVDVTDGAWHKATCWRRAATIGVTVDGVSTSRTYAVGAITITRAATVAGRGLAAKDASDQFVGDVDALVWAVGGDAKPAAITYAAGVVHPS